MNNVAEESSGLIEETRMKTVTQDNKENNMTNNSFLSKDLDETGEQVFRRDSFKGNLDGQEEATPNYKPAKRKTSLVNKLRESFYQYRSKNGQKFPPECKGTDISDSSVQEWPIESGVDLDLSDPEANANKENDDAENNDEGLYNKSCLSLFHIIHHSKLVAVTLQRKPEEEWGVQLSHSNMADWASRRQKESQDEETMDKDFSLKGSTVSPGTTALLSTKHPMSRGKVCNDPGNSVVELRQNVLKRSVKRKLGRIKRSFSSIKQSPQSCPAVHIVGMTEGGVAERSGEIAVEDLIVEVNGTIVLNCSLEHVTCAMEQSLVVNLVVSRNKKPKYKEQ
ncbi:hypothetical protein ACROYT_G010830 [Oculina patagonica]